jgi:hypothetical protein
MSKFDMVWLNHSPIPVGRRPIIRRRGVIFLFKDFYLPSLLVEEAEGEVVGTLWKGRVHRAHTGTKLEGL